MKSFYPVFLINICCCVLFISVVYLYGNMERKNEINYNAVNSMALHTVQCWEENGDLNTYQIPVPRLEGFSKEEKNEILEEYAKGFCDTL